AEDGIRDRTVTGVQTCALPISRTVEVNLTDVTTAQALDLIFLQEGLFFQKINRHTILVADQNRRVQYQQLAIRTFYLANTNPERSEERRVGKEYRCTKVPA